MRRTNQTTQTFKNKLKRDFTPIPNCIVNDAQLSWKALGIFTYLASKPDDWDFYMHEIKKHASDGIVALRSGIKELEDAGYLIRRPRWDPDQKKYGGWEWVLTTPEIEKSNLTQNLYNRKPVTKETYAVGNTEEYSKTNNNNTNNNNTNNTTPDSGESAESVNNTPSERNKKFLPIAKHLSKSIQKEKNIHHPKTQLKSWANDIRLLHEQNKIPIPRIKKALSWYRRNIGGQFIPVIESGSSLRAKFINLEDAMKRHSGSFKKSNSPSNGVYDPNLKHKEAEETV